MKKNIVKSIKKVNLGIEILRLLLCLWIVFIHCSKIKKGHKQYFSKRFHVPSFFLISFYFYFPTLSKRLINKIILRFQRLLIPYLLWPTIRLIIIIIINNIHVKYPKILSEKKFALKDIYMQILIGSSIHNILWFQFNLLFLSLFFTIISFVFKKNTINILLLIGNISFYFHLSRLSYNFLNTYKHYHLRYNLGNLIELMPIAVNGCILNSINILVKIKDISTYLNFIFFFKILILFKYDIFINQPGFYYSNVSLNIISSIMLFLLFGALPLYKIENEKFILFIRYITKFNGGIYYTHIIFRNYLRKYSLFFYNRSYFSSLIIYFMCYFFCFIGNKLFKNNKIKYLFI